MIAPRNTHMDRRVPSGSCAHTVRRCWQICSACLFLFVCSWWPTRCCSPASTCRGCLWGFSPSAPRGKSSCRPATASRRGWGWRTRTRNRWGVNLHTHQHTEMHRWIEKQQKESKTTQTRALHLVLSAYVQEIFTVSWEVFFFFF